MPIPEDVDQDKLAQVALAILSLSTWKDGSGMRAWKGMDWDLMNLLHENGWIGDPVGKEKSVLLTEEGLTLSEAYLEKYFGK